MSEFKKSDEANTVPERKALKKQYNKNLTPQHTTELLLRLGIDSKPFQRFEFQKWLNAGQDSGQGECFRVRKDDRDLFLKVLALEKFPAARERFLREVNTLRLLNKSEVSGVAQLVDCDVSSTPLWLVLDFIPGHNLSQSMKDRIPAENAFSLFRSLMRIITACHANGVSHRDIKPANIMLRDNTLADPVLVDFGVVYAGFDDVTRTKETLQVGCVRCSDLAASDTDRDTAKSRKRDQGIDRLQAVGVLLYTLTNCKLPISAHADEKNALVSSYAKLDVFLKRPLLFQFFLSGLNDRASERFASDDAMMIAFEKAIVPPQTSMEELTAMLHNWSVAPSPASRKAAKDTSHIRWQRALDDFFDQLEWEKKNNGRWTRGDGAERRAIFSDGDGEVTCEFVLNTASISVSFATATETTYTGALPQEVSRTTFFQVCADAFGRLISTAGEWLAEPDYVDGDSELD